MSRKIEFIVVNSSSHEDNSSANELMVHAPTVNGWRSSRYINTVLCFQKHVTLIHVNFLIFKSDKTLCFMNGSFLVHFFYHLKESSHCVNEMFRRLCSYPQHITLQLVERSRVRKLQLLAHQYLIPAKVEFHIGDTLPETSTSGFPGQLRRLG